MSGFETAPTGRAKCRGCGAKIDKGELRFSDVLANPFADDAELTHWYHPRCAAYKRPEQLLAGLQAPVVDVADRDELAAAAKRGLDHRRLRRIDGAERASSGRAMCRGCREKIDKGTWRIRLAFFENSRYEPGGFVHAGCAATYFESNDVEDLLARASQFTSGLDAESAEDLRRALGVAPGR